MINELCGSGNNVRYSHFKGGKQVMSCNKYTVCKSYDEQSELLVELTSKIAEYEQTLFDIVMTDAKDYEYKTWAKEALSSYHEISDD